MRYDFCCQDEFCQRYNEQWWHGKRSNLRKGMRIERLHFSIPASLVPSTSNTNNTATVIAAACCMEREDEAGLACFYLRPHPMK